MSKSLGNFFTIREILEQYHPEVLRFFLLQSHYRSPVDFSDAALNEARQGMNRFYTTLKALQDIAPEGSFLSVAGQQLFEEEEGGLRGQFVEAMDDDFNTARAIGHLFDAVRAVNAYLADKKKIVSPGFAVQMRDVLLETGHVLGLFFEKPEIYLEEDRIREAKRRKLDVAEIERLIEERKEARSAKDWKRADEIRKELGEMGVVIQDAADATVWAIA